MYASLSIRQTDRTSRFINYLKYNFEVIDEVVVWPKRADQVIRFLKENPDVLFDLATRLSLGIVGLLEKIENATYTNAYHKILSLLLYLANHYAFSAKDT